VVPSQPEPLAASWDAALLKHGGHLLQSWKWGEFKSRFGWQPERVSVVSPDGEGYAQVLFRQKGPISVGYIPRGPLMTGDPDKVWPALRREIDRAARRHRALTVYIEPDAETGLSSTFREAGVVLGPGHMQPSRTVKVPLSDDDGILKQMHQKTRYNVRLAIRRGVDVDIKSADDKAALRQFYELMEDTSNRNEFSIHSYDYYEEFLKVFGDDAFFVFASWEGNLSAVVIAAAFGDEAVYMYGASSSVHRAHGAAFLLQFEAMKWARDRGCKTYDLWGIPKVDPGSLRAEDNSSIAGSKGDDWRGIYRFKTGFGGDIVSYPETLERRYVPVLPWLVRRAGVIQE
jgi:lipid II:glycine glycyltransferase (peptidoglycan interpeptide bridge formation enzyme)